MYVYSMHTIAYIYHIIYIYAYIFIYTYIYICLYIIARPPTHLARAQNQRFDHDVAN